jgi:hypothetical protein
MKTVKNIILLCLVAVSFFAYKTSMKNNEELVVKNAAMPFVTKDTRGAIHIVFAKGNRLEYVTSDDNGINFSSPVLVDTINGLFGVAGRGPKIISTPHTLAILALDMAGNIYAYTKYENDNWIKRGKVNDVADVCKEGFLSVSAKEDSLCNLA